jgi:hypothetical protein
MQLKNVINSPILSFCRQTLAVSMTLRRVFETCDLASLVFPTLDLYTLLKVSMASRATKRLVDKLASNVFAHSSQFELKCLVWFEGTVGLELLRAVSGVVLYLYVDTSVGETQHAVSRAYGSWSMVSMTINFHVPLKHVVVLGSLLPEDMVHIFVMLWKVVGIQEEQYDQRVGTSLGRCSMATVRSEAVQFNTISRVEMPYAIILNVRNILVDNSLTARELAVMSVCSMCMNCRQLPRAFESIGVSDKQCALSRSWGCERDPFCCT